MYRIRLKSYSLNGYKDSKFKNFLYIFADKTLSISTEREHTKGWDRHRMLCMQTYIIDNAFLMGLLVSFAAVRHFTQAYSDCCAATVCKAKRLYLFVSIDSFDSFPYDE